MSFTKKSLVLLCVSGLLPLAGCLAEGRSNGGYSYVTSPEDSTAAATAAGQETPSETTSSGTPSAATTFASTSGTEPATGIPVQSMFNAASCLSGANKSAGAAVVAGSCVDPNTHASAWRLSGGFVVLDGNMCLDSAPVADPNTAMQPVISACDGSSLTQQWNYVGNTLRISGTQRCLAWPAGATGGNANLVLADCADATPDTHNQWTLGAQSGFEIVALANPNTCLRAVNNQTTSGASVVLGACSASAPQLWQFSNNTLTLGGRCLDLVAATPADGTAMQLVTCNGGPNQQWMLRYGHLRLAALLECVEETIANLGDGTSTIIQACTTSAAQQFVVQ